MYEKTQLILVINKDELGFKRKGIPSERTYIYLAAFFLSFSAPIP
jgi:hypothetical protein